MGFLYNASEAGRENTELLTDKHDYIKYILEAFTYLLIAIGKYYWFETKILQFGFSDSLNNANGLQSHVDLFYVTHPATLALATSTAVSIRIYILVLFKISCRKCWRIANNIIFVAAST